MFLRLAHDDKRLEVTGEEPPMCPPLQRHHGYDCIASHAGLEGKDSRPSTTEPAVAVNIPLSGPPLRPVCEAILKLLGGANAESECDAASRTPKVIFTIVNTDASVREVD